MNRFSFKMIIIFLFIVPLLAGCTMRLGSLTAISTKNVNLNKLDLDKLPQVKGIKGEDSVYIILGIPLGSPTIQGAIEDALEKGNGDLMLDPVMYNEAWSLWLIGQASITVKGNVVNTMAAKTEAVRVQGTATGTKVVADDTNAKGTVKTEGSVSGNTMNTTGAAQ